MLAGINPGSGGRACYTNDLSRQGAGVLRQFVVPRALIRKASMPPPMLDRRPGAAAGNTQGGPGGRRLGLKNLTLLGSAGSACAASLRGSKLAHGYPVWTALPVSSQRRDMVQLGFRRLRRLNNRSLAGLGPAAGPLFSTMFIGRIEGPDENFSATDLKQNVGDVLDAASREPVAITRHNKPRCVIVASTPTRRSFRTRPGGDRHRGNAGRSHADDRQGRR